MHQLESDFLAEHRVQLFLKRDDLIHPEVSGNKWRKLELNITKAQEFDLPILTFGGAYSNHIAATAAACHHRGIACIGMIRGEEHDGLNPTLSLASKLGMQLHFISREEYGYKAEEAYIRQLKDNLGAFHLVPEGGANFLGVMGCTSIIKELPKPFDILCVAGGTGTTAAGMLLGLKANQRLELYPALKGGEFLQKSIAQLLEYSLFEEMAVNETLENLIIVSDYHFGGYAKINAELVDFTQHFFNEYSVPLDLIYTSKMMFGLFDRISKGLYNKGTSIIAVHTGGLQGNEGFKSRKGITLNF
ncbi:MAG: pyridoxal-phosphate dependent enzyme [Flavobacteriales bacterium]|nr:pyridoxal-phosphate dependent enzyme [Flavobacteriales bacterium]